MIHKELISFFTSTNYAAKDVAALIGNRCHYSYVPQSQVNTFPRIYLERTSYEDEGFLDGTKGQYVEEEFSLEVISDSSTEVENICDELWTDIHLHYGSISSDLTVKGLFLETQDDDYEPKGIGNDIGVDVSSFNLRVVHGTG